MFYKFEQIIKQAVDKYSLTDNLYTISFKQTLLIPYQFQTEIHFFQKFEEERDKAKCELFFKGIPSAQHHP